MLLANASSIPRSEKVLRRAVCLATDALHSVVMIAGASSGGLLNVSAFDPAVDLTGPGTGLIVNKISSTLCVVQLSGPVTNTLTGLTPGKAYFVGEDSLLTATPPAPSVSGIMYVQEIGVAMSATDLMLNIQQPTKRVG